MFGIGMGEFLVILVVGLIIFGPKNLPEVGKALGKGLREFRKAQAALSATLEESVNEPVKKSSDENKTVQKVSIEKNSEVAQATAEKENSAPKEISTSTVSETAEEKNLEKKSEEPARATVDDLISAVKENPISNKNTDEKISITKESINS
jgi:TatA/E family protein of Tat protein translocase